MAYSYSALQTYKTCPKQYEAVYKLKTVPKVASDAMAKGTEIHSHLEKLLRGEPSECRHDIAIPDGFDIETLRSKGAKSERRFAVSRYGKSLPFDDPAAFLRGIVDAVWVESGIVHVLDWKSGKFYPDHLQADVYAHLLRVIAGSVRIPVTFHWVYVSPSEKTSHSADVDEFASHRVMHAIDTIERDESFPARVGPLCRFCPVSFCRNHPMFGSDSD